MQWEAFGPRLRAEEVFQMENGAREMKGFKLKPGSGFPDCRGSVREALPSPCAVTHASAGAGDTLHFLWCKPEQEPIPAFEQLAGCYQQNTVASLFIQLLMEVMD